MALYLVKIGELALKGGNRHVFEKALKINIKRRLSGKSRFYGGFGRYYLETECSKEEVSSILSSTFGVVRFAETIKTEKDLESVSMAALSIADQARKDFGDSTFKIEARRQDKSFPLSSYEIACRLGSLVSEQYSCFKVSVTRPDWVLHAEIRDQAIIYGPGSPGPGGLPCGTAGKGILLLSGGIDSPVAGYMMGKRGLALEALYFHSHPFTSEQAKEKVLSLGSILTSYIPGFSVTVVPFTEVLLRIREKAKEEELTLLLRACMMSVANSSAIKRGAVALVTGEALSQVASQTPESLHFTGSFSSLPVFRPCIGLDKEEIINLARKIGSFETSILPYEDCCSLFAPSHPIIKPDFNRMMDAYKALDIEELLLKSLEEAEVFN